MEKEYIHIPEKYDIDNENCIIFLCGLDNDSKKLLWEKRASAEEQIRENPSSRSFFCKECLKKVLT